MVTLSPPHMSGPTWPILAIFASVALLLGAHAFEIFGKMAPCTLCLRQRDVYWAAMAMAATGLVFWQQRPAGRYLVALNIMLGLVFLTGAIVAVYHAGVEWGWWRGPAGCSGGGTTDIGTVDLSAALSGKIATVSCSEAPWRLLGLSMAGYNALASLTLAILSFAAARVTFAAARRKAAAQLSSSTSQ